MSKIFLRSTRGMILTEQNRSTGKEKFPNFTLFSTNPIWTGLGSNTGCNNEMPAT